MRHRLVVATGLVFVSMHAQAFLGGADQALPVKDGRPVVATVNGESISLDEFVAQLEPPVDAKRLLEGQGNAAELGLLDRLITVRLVVQEAATMGLGDLPEIRKQIDVASRDILRDVLRESVVKDVKPDAAAVEKRFKDLVKEYKTVSVLFAEEESAKSLLQEVAKGADFAEAAARAVADKRARTDGDQAYHPQKDYLPQIAEAIAQLEVGQVSPVIRVQAGFVVLKVADIRYPDNAEARAEAFNAVAEEQRLAALKTYEDALSAQYVEIKQDVLDSVDYDAKEPGIDALLKDTRIVAEVKGGTPVTVGDLTDDLRMQVFHRADQAGRGKRFNARKGAALAALLGRRVLNMEALRLGIDKTPAYLDRINAFEESLVFGAFVQKAIAPDNKMREEEVKGYYDGHLGDYSSPEMMRIRSLAFTESRAADAATRRLREGADYGWVAANAEGQADKGTPGLLALDGRPITTDSMPDGMQKAVEGAKKGEFRLYASPEGPVYVLAIQDVIAPAARPYSEARDEIAKKLYGEKLTKGVEDYAGKLRAVSKVEVYLRKMP